MPLQLYADGGYQLRIRSLEGTPNYGPRQVHLYFNKNYWSKLYFGDRVVVLNDN
jgi:hypothetical protein